ncbi:MAG: hypothetical protein AVDCRST_MAG03-401, partial [uncultured Rubrobacteraceae bacterium]
ERRRAGHHSGRLYPARFPVERARPAELQRRLRRGGGRRVFERGFWYLGVRLYRPGHLLRLQGVAVLHFYRDRVDVAYRVGRAASPVREPHRSVRRGIVAGMRHQRPGDSPLVLRGRPIRIRPSTPKTGTRWRV